MNYVKAVSLAFLVFMAAASLKAQSVGKTYTYLICHKLSPGLTIQDALPVEKEWRAINQAAVDEGKLIGWFMMVKQMSSNPNNDYDYVTVIVSPEMSMKGASAEAMAKLYGDDVKNRMADLQKRDRATAPVVKMETWETMDGVFASSFSPEKTPLVVVDFMKLRDPAIDWTTLLAPLKQLNGSRLKHEGVIGAGLSALVVPKGSEKGYSLIAFQNVTSQNILANPGAETTRLQTQLNRSFDVVRQELFRFTEFTTRPKK